jgi:hypothetical protein
VGWFWKSRGASGRLGVSFFWSHRGVFFSEKRARGLSVAGGDPFSPQRLSSPKSSAKEAPTPERPPKKLSSEKFLGEKFSSKKEVSSKSFLDKT